MRGACALAWSSDETCCAWAARRRSRSSPFGPAAVLSGAHFRPGEEVRSGGARLLDSWVCGVVLSLQETSSSGAGAQRHLVLRNSQDETCSPRWSLVVLAGADVQTRDILTTWHSRGTGLFSPEFSCQVVARFDESGMKSFPPGTAPPGVLLRTKPELPRLAGTMSEQVRSRSEHQARESLHKDRNHTIRL